jgi:hypothetical protein
MPDYATIQAKLNSIKKATALLGELRGIYDQCLKMQAALALYTAGTDAVFNAAVDDIYTIAEKQELNQMLTEVDALVSDWQTNHGGLLGLG